MCGGLRSLRAVRPIVRNHHERLDGSGYPDALKGEDIPLLAHIMGIVDVYDAMTTEPPYRRPTTPAAACDELIREAKHGRHGRELSTRSCRSSQTAHCRTPAIHGSYELHGGPQTTEGRRVHNVRNQLSVILGFCDLLLSEIPEHDRKHGDLLEMRKAANTALTLLEDTRSTT